MGTIGDDMRSIFRQSQGSGADDAARRRYRHDFSTLRPAGAQVKGVGADAYWPGLVFMDVWDAMCRTIMSAGARRGAMMADTALRPS